MVEKSGRADPYRQAIIDRFSGTDLPTSLSRIETAILAGRYRTTPRLTYNQISQEEGKSITALYRIEMRAFQKILRPKPTTVKSSP